MKNIKIVRMSEDIPAEVIIESARCIVDFSKKYKEGENAIWNAVFDGRKYSIYVKETKSMIISYISFIMEI